MHTFQLLPALVFAVPTNTGAYSPPSHKKVPEGTKCQNLIWTEKSVWLPAAVAV